MKLRRRALREFIVVLGETTTINGQKTDKTSPQEVLEEIYQMAEGDLFPLTITVRGPNSVHIIEMDEDMNTRPLPEGDERHETAEIVAKHPRLKPKTLGVVGGSLLAVVAIGVISAQIFNGGAQANEKSWLTPLPTNEVTSQELTEGLPRKLWTIEPGEADSVSWFAAGVVATNESTREISLRSMDTGKTLAKYAAPEGKDLSKELHWVAEFLYEGQPAVGLRVDRSFVGMTRDGIVTEWNVPEGMEVSVRGTTPMLTNDKTQKDPKKIEYKALIAGKKDPVQLTVNRQLVTRSIDGDWIVQLDLNRPVVALTPVDRKSGKEAQAVTLAAPLEEATFVQHLEAGHGYSVALWNVGEELYVGVHSLTGETAGESSSFVPAPFKQADAKSWSIGAGMKLALLGTYAFSLETGELTERSSGSSFSRAYGEIAVSQDEADMSRTLTLDHIEYPESERIVGYADRGVALVRLIDGSVAAYGKSGGQD